MEILNPVDGLLVNSHGVAMPHHDSLGFIHRLLERVQTGWLVLGSTLAIFLVLEGGYRVAREVSHSLRPERVAGTVRPDHPYHGQSWYADWAPRRDEVLSDSANYDPYRGWQLPAVSLPGLHVDAAGRRLTPQANLQVGTTRQVFFLGGSTMWGYTARDSSTIPSLVAVHLARRGIRNVTMVNLANMGYNATQEAITLILELRRGNVPSMVVVLDGINEVGPVEEGNRVGDVYTQTLLAQRFEGKSPIQELLAHSAFLNRLLLFTAGKSGPNRDVDSSCVAISQYYSNIVQEVEALSRAYGFPTLYLWQPTLARSRKRLTSWERSLASGHPELQRLTAVCTARIDSTMRSSANRTYFPFHSVFDDDTSSVFLDQWGHVTERANDVIAKRIAELIDTVLATPTAPETAGGKPPIRH